MSENGERLTLAKLGILLYNWKKFDMEADSMEFKVLAVGDVVEFSLCYSHMLYATARSDMRINFKHTQEE